LSHVAYSIFTVLENIILDVFEAFKGVLKLYLEGNAFFKQLVVKMYLNITGKNQKTFFYSKNIN